MKRSIIALLLLLLATVAPAAAGDYWIGNYAYAIDGATVRAAIYCQSDRRIAIYELTATDTAEHRYWLMYEEWEIPDITVSHTGLVYIERTDMIWIAHDVGDIARVTVTQPGCWPRDEDPLEPRYRLHLSRLHR
jgi:hypothetical protein